VRGREREKERERDREREREREREGARGIMSNKKMNGNLSLGSNHPLYTQKGLAAVYTYGILLFYYAHVLQNADTMMTL
jgi:hypothetical protein